MTLIDADQTLGWVLSSWAEMLFELCDSTSQERESKAGLSADFSDYTDFILSEVQQRGWDSIVGTDIIASVRQTLLSGGKLSDLQQESVLPWLTALRDLIPLPTSAERCVPLVFGFLPKQGYLGIVVDEARGEVRRNGCNHGQPVTFAIDAADWHTFMVAFRAGERGATDAEWQRGYPGEWKHRRQRKNRVNEKLAPLGVQLAAYELKLETVPQM